MTERIGYTSISLNEQMANIDKLTEEQGIYNRSQTIRMILKRYFDLKDKGIDILKMNNEELKKEMMK